MCIRDRSGTDKGMSIDREHTHILVQKWAVPEVLNGISEGGYYWDIGVILYVNG